MNRRNVSLGAILALVASAGCSAPDSDVQPVSTLPAARLDKYTSVRLDAPLDGLSDNRKKMIPLLIEAAQAMDAAFWKQAYGDRDALLDTVSDDATRRFVQINYGPWDRLGDNEPFIDGAGAKPKGANLYPADVTVEEFEQAVQAAADGGAALKSLYTVVRRDEQGALVTHDYSSYFAEEVRTAAAKLRAAAELAEDPGFKRYLELRAAALLDDEYRQSDLAWMEMKDNVLDIVIGPIEVYEDQLFGYKASFTGYVLLKDLEWSARLARYAEFLPELQRGMPVPQEYKREEPGTDADLNAYDVLYYAGDCNAGSKTIAINLPNDEQVQLQKGTRRLQLKNAVRAKFDKILLPISELLIAEDQRQHVSFDAFFGNTMFHEVAHGLGIKNTLDGSSTVRQALKDQASALEEGKADILGLYMVTSLHDAGEMGQAPLADYYVTFLASIFRSIRFGSSSAHGRANMVRFNFFKEAGAFVRDESDGTYRADLERMKQAIAALSEKILRLQGDGDYEAARAFVADNSVRGAQLEADLARLGQAGIPVDVVFEQGVEVLGL